MNRKDEIKLMVTIVSRGRSEKVLKMFQEENLGLHYVSLGLGTANSEILDYFGIGETEKFFCFDTSLSFTLFNYQRKGKTFWHDVTRMVCREIRSKRSENNQNKTPVI